MTTAAAVTAAVSLAPVGSPVEASDDVLVAALRDRDEQAYLQLVRRHSPLMLRVARSMVGGREAAEDVVQDTWVAVLRSIDRFEGRSSFRTWLMRILVNTARRRRGRDARTVCWSTSPEDVPVWDAVLASRSAGTPGPLDRALGREVWVAIRSAFAQLPERQRMVVLMRDVEGTSSEEVRDLLGLSAGNQRVLLHRGRARLRQLLGGPDHGLIASTPGV